ncbi:hypothetical protein [Streptomyces niveus]|uniref:hypothetical protein n=1 Tax=Streptomyces niveus TaxID=193462 RepID=UPI0003C5D9BC|nr:hypothetical protein [Streptomyces niveus]EST22809.1 hypothetical protein M877_28950 [Streptomyces niveus NCIMB 11891]
MSGALLPTIGGATPGFGLRVRLDGPHALPIADFNCACGRAEGATGADDVIALVVRFEQHTQRECPIAEVREAAALRSAARSRTEAKKRRK